MIYQYLIFEFFFVDIFCRVWSLAAIGSGIGTKNLYHSHSLHFFYSFFLIEIISSFLSIFSPSKWPAEGPEFDSERRECLYDHELDAEERQKVAHGMGECVIETFGEMRESLCGVGEGGLEEKGSLEKRMCAWIEKTARHVEGKRKESACIKNYFLFLIFYFIFIFFAIFLQSNSHFVFIAKRFSLQRNPSLLSVPMTFIHPPSPSLISPSLPSLLRIMTVSIQIERRREERFLWQVSV